MLGFIGVYYYVWLMLTLKREHKLKQV
jgi:hypothetical protein